MYRYIVGLLFAVSEEGADGTPSDGYWCNSLLHRLNSVGKNDILI